MHVAGDELHVLGGEVAERVGVLEEVGDLEEVEASSGHQLRRNLVDHNVVGFLGDPERLHDLAEGAAADHHRLECVVAVQADDHALADPSEAVPAAAHTLEEPGDLPRAVILDD